jgi:hypothetical protein
VDSISHAWAGEGGLLSKKEALDARGGNSYMNWAGISKEHEIFKARILNADIILICTMRSKQDYVLEVNDKGKQAPKKVGLAPIQRDGMEYEFTTVFDLAMDHNAQTGKDRTSMFDGQIFKITKKTGEQIMSWLAGGKPVEPKPASPAPQPPVEKSDDEFVSPDDLPADEPQIVLATGTQLTKISDGIAALIKIGITSPTIWTGIGKETTLKHGRVIVDTAGLSNGEAETIIDYLNRWAEHLRNGKAKHASSKSFAGMEA